MSLYRGKTLLSGLGEQDERNTAASKYFIIQQKSFRSL